MSVSQLRKLLDDEATFEDFNFVVPHPFLPPRYQKLSKERNMILVFDRDLCLHVRWEGARMHEHHPLTPRAATRLVKEVLKNMTKYRREINVFSRFIEEFGEQPFDDPRCDPITKERKPGPASKSDGSVSEIPAIIHIPSTPKLDPIQLELELNAREQLGADDLEEMRRMDIGGESPIGEVDGY